MTALLASASDPFQISFPVTSPVVWLGMLALGTPLLISAFNGLLSIINHFRKNPPDHVNYATKGELRELEGRINGRIEDSASDLEAMEQRQNKARSEMEERLSDKLTRVDGFETALQRELKEIHSQLGRIFGTLEASRKGPGK